MTKKQEQTASFMVRFHQQIFEEDGESKIQWRGKISHVQDGDEKRFSDFNDALTFMQNKLADLTEEATKYETSAKQENMLNKSLSMWKTIKDVGPKVLRDTLKDPKKQFTHFQDEIQDKINIFGDEISEKVQINEWRNASRSDFNKIQQQIASLSTEIKNLSTKMDTIKKK
jgi:predicted  nucleic acid-binding Zn-ribbon protein